MTEANKEQSLEEQIEALGLTAPRVTDGWIDSIIESVDFFKLSPSHVLCKITVFGGRFHVTGESATVSAENFNEEIGQKVSYRNAREKLWPFLGAILAHELHRGRLPLTEEQQKLDAGVQQVISQLNQTMAWNKGMIELLSIPREQLLAQGVDEAELNDLTEQANLLQTLSDLLQRRLSRAGL